MATGISLSVAPNLGLLARRFRAARDAMGDFRAPFRESSVFLDRWVQRNFRSEGGEVGGWPPLKPATVRNRLRRQIRSGASSRGPGAGTLKILQVSGRLRLSFAPFHSPVQAGIGSDLPYSKYHEEGAGPLPVRRMLPKRREVIGDIRDIFRRHMARVGRLLTGGRR